MVHDKTARDWVIKQNGYTLARTFLFIRSSIMKGKVLEAARSR